jgi:hypothetical protein
MAVAGDRGVDGNAVDLEPAHVDVDVREKRRVGVAGAKLRQPVEPRLRNLQPLDVDMITEISKGAPVERGLGRGEEQALRVLQRDVIDFELAEQRAFDPADVDVEPGRRLQFVDLVDDVAMAERGVQPDEEKADQHDDAEQAEAAPAGGLPRPEAAARNRNRRGRHQKA